VKSPRIIIIGIFIVFFLISSLIFTKFIIDLYDQNCFLNAVEKGVKDRRDKIADDYFVLNIESKVESSTFLDLLYYLNDGDADSVYFDLNFTNLSDSTSINDIRDYIKSRNNIFGYIKVNKQKGTNLFNRNSYDNISKDLTYLKTNVQFSFAYYKNPLKVENPFSVGNDKIGFIYDAKSAFDADNIDLLYKMDNKFLFNLSFLNFSFKHNLSIGDMIFSGSTGAAKNYEIYYDQKGRMSFIHGFEKPSVSAGSFLYWKNSLTARREALENMKALDLVKSQESGYNLFQENEIAVSDIYNTPDSKDERKDTLLTVAKNKASLWKSFKDANKNNIVKKKVIIAQNADYGWVSNFIYECDIFDKGENIKRLPLSGIIIFCLLVLLALLFSSLKIKKIPAFIGIVICFVIASDILYFVFRIFLSCDFPFIVLLAISLYSIAGGLLLRNINHTIWMREVKSIFHSNISAVLGRQIIDLLRSGKWNLDSKQYISTFLTVDTKIFLEKEFQEEDIDTISQKTTEIENIIKNNSGVIDSVNAGYISCYFGNPPIKNDPVMDAIKTANSINEIPLVLNNNTQRLKIAIHSRKEWFKYQEKYGEKYYSHYGNSYNILSALLKVANEFEIGVVISDAVYKLAGMNLPVRMFDRIKIKGLKNSLRVFELLSQKQAEDMGEMLEYFHAGLKLFEQKKWEEAGAYFRQCLKIRPNDVPSMIYLQRCKDFIYVPPTENWDGSYEVD
jgi:hypothetical protein